MRFALSLCLLSVPDLSPTVVSVPALINMVCLFCGEALKFNVEVVSEQS